MNQLPHQFEFRNKAFPGFTHSAKKNAWGDYEVKWARGYVEKLATIPHKVYGPEYMQQLVDTKIFVVVDYEPKPEVVVPDEFYFRAKYHDRDIFKVDKLKNGFYRCTCPKESPDDYCDYKAEEIRQQISEGYWTILEKRPLTAEEQRRKKDFEERIAQLDQSIKLNEQSIEHYNRLVANYKATKDDLLTKLKEMEGV